MGAPKIFNNIYGSDDYADWHGKEVAIVTTFMDPFDEKQTAVVDPEAMPVVRYRLKETGEFRDGYPEEIPEESWPKTFVAFYKGLEYFKRGISSNPYSEYEWDEQEYFGFGYACAEIKATSN